MTDPENSETWKKIARAIIPLPQRSILAIMTFLGVGIAYGMRICLSITIISIVEPKHHSLKNTSHECPFPPDYNTGSIEKDPIYTWDEQLIGNILSAFYIGYVITHLPGGIMSDILGGKHVLIGCVLLTSIFTIITPVSIIYGGPYLLIGVRVLIGFVQGALFPAINVLLAAWIPKNERSFYGAMVYGSSQIGTIFGTAISGLLLAHFHSWQKVYYVFGIAGVVWVILFTLMCSSDPQTHSYISYKEKEMLLDKIGIIQRTTRIQDAPWGEMLRNVPLLALVICGCGHDFGFFVMVSYLPKYLSDVLHYNIQTNGFLSAMPFILMYIISILSGIFSDLIINYDLLSLVNCRKVFTTLASFLPSLGLILASYAGCDRTLVVISFTIGMSTMGFYYSSLRVNALDLSPNFAGIVMAYANGVGAIMGVIGPIIIGTLTANSTVVEYRTGFWITFILLNATCVVFIFFASGNVQPFNDHGKPAKPSE